VDDVLRDEDISLGIAGYRFSDLYDPRRLRALHEGFWKFAGSRDGGLAARFASLGTGALTKPQESELLIETAGHLGEFLARLFAIDDAAEQLREETLATEAIYRFRKDFLRARVFKNFDQPPVDDARFRALDDEVERMLAAVPERGDAEIRFAETVLALLDAEKALAATAATSEQSAVRNRLCPSASKAR
jgi:hypothetical protein